MPSCSHSPAPLPPSFKPLRTRTTTCLELSHTTTEVAHPSSHPPASSRRPPHHTTHTHTHTSKLPQAPPPAPTDHSINYILNFGQLRPRWQLFLDAFFRHSDEHSRPWTVEGNLQPLPEQSSPNRSTAVLVWHLPQPRACPACRLLKALALLCDLRPLHGASLYWQLYCSCRRRWTTYAGCRWA